MCFYVAFFLPSLKKPKKHVVWIKISFCFLFLQGNVSQLALGLGLNFRLEETLPYQRATHRNL